MRRVSLLLIAFIFSSLFSFSQSKNPWKILPLNEESLSYLERNEYLFSGIANNSSIPQNKSGKEYYLLSLPGEYPNFGGITIYDGETCIVYREMNSAIAGFLRSLFGSKIKYETTIHLSKYELKNSVLTIESGWEEKNSEITVLTNYAASCA